MEIIIDFFKRPFVKRIFVLLLIGIILYFLRGQLTMFLLAFIFIYLVNSAQNFIYRLLKINRKVIIILLYLVIISLLFLLVYIYVPKIIQQTTDIVKSATDFISNYDITTKTNNAVLDYLYGYFQKIDLQNYLKNNGVELIDIIGNISNVSINVIMALVLSMFFLLQKEKIMDFFRKFKHSKIYWLYDELQYFGVKFTNSFGKVIQAQILISLINSVLSVIFLSLLGFPNTIGLFIMIFVLGMIPVAGVIVSILPLSIIAYSIGGINYVLYMIIMIVILHVLESYILNPNIMSHHTKLPVFITFLVLILSQHFLGTWGLIVGIPITMFFLDVLEVKTDP